MRVTDTTVPGACCHISRPVGHSQSFRLPTFEFPSFSIPPCGTAVNNPLFRLFLRRQLNVNQPVNGTVNVARRTGFLWTPKFRSAEPPNSIQKPQQPTRSRDDIRNHSDGGMGTPNGSRAGAEELLVLLGIAAENNNSGVFWQGEICR